MPILLVLVFVGVPLLELAVILQVGGAIGGWWTAALLILFSIVGAMLLRFEGRRAWSEFRLALGEGRWPGDEVAQGALIIVGGTLLVTPGFITDLVGFLLLLGPSRRLVSRRVRKRMEGAVITGGPAGAGPAAGRGGSRRSTTRRGTTTGDGVSLDVEVVEIRREQPPPAGSSGSSGAGEPIEIDDVDEVEIDEVEIEDDRPDDAR
jgi:UPF0716 protein FxsA